MKQFAKITIKEISLDCILGAWEKEREKKQTVLVSLELLIDATRASQTDTIVDTVNYSALYQKIIQHVSSSSYYLLEALVLSILTLCLEEKGILEATVRVEKPNALPKAKGVVLEMTKKKSNR
jgi:FolB domain-containing protein